MTTANDTGIWAEDLAGALTLVAREGSLFEVAPGEFRTCSSLYFIGMSGGEDGRRITYNDDLTLAFQATFTDGTSGIFAANLLVPEPGAALLA